MLVFVCYLSANLGKSEDFGYRILDLVRLATITDLIKTRNQDIFSGASGSYRIYASNYLVTFDDRLLID